MKVAFWSGVRKAGGVTCNLAAISIAMALLYDCNIILGSDHISSDSLETCMLQQKKDRTKPYYYCYGETEYFGRLWESRKDLNGDIIGIPMQGITLIRQPDATDKNMFYYKALKKDIYMMDVSGKSNIASRCALEEADLVVVCLPQDTQEIHKFFDRYSSLRSKSLFLLSSFKRNGEVFPKYLINIYGIEKRNILQLPYCTAYAQAYEESNLEVFLKENLKCPTKNPHFYFMSYLRQVTDVLYERTIVRRRK